MARMHHPVADSLPRRRTRLHHWTEAWLATVAVCLVVAVISGIGLSRTADDRGTPVVVFTVLALLSALIALVATIARAQAGNTLGEKEISDAVHHRLPYPAGAHIDAKNVLPHDGLTPDRERR